MSSELGHEFTLPPSARCRTSGEWAAYQVRPPRIFIDGLKRNFTVILAVVANAAIDFDYAIIIFASSLLYARAPRRPYRL